MDAFLHNRQPLTLLHEHLCKEPREQSQLGILFHSKVLLCVQWPAPAFGHFRMKANELINISCDSTLGIFVHHWLVAVSKARGIKYECDEWIPFSNVSCFRLCLKGAFCLRMNCYNVGSHMHTSVASGMWCSLQCWDSFASNMSVLPPFPSLFSSGFIKRLS